MSTLRSDSFEEKRAQQLRPVKLNEMLGGGGQTKLGGNHCINANHLEPRNVDFHRFKRCQLIEECLDKMNGKEESERFMSIMMGMILER